MSRGATTTTRLDGVEWRVEYVVSSKATREGEGEGEGEGEDGAAPESAAVLRLKLVDGSDDARGGGDDDEDDGDDGVRTRVLECELTTEALHKMDDALAAVSARVEALKAKAS